MSKTRGKRYKDAEKERPSDAVSLVNAVKTLKSMKGTKFDQTINLVMHLGIDTKHADQNLRGSVALPKGIGKTKRVVVFCQQANIEKAKAVGATEAGVDELVKKIEGGWFDFDVAIATPDAMGKVGKLGRVLGPKGLMPSPKSGTVTPDFENAVKEYSAGKLEYRNDNGGNIHAVIGKLSFSEGDLVENAEAFIGHIQRQKPAAAKGTFIKKVCVAATMSPSILLDVK